MRAETVVLADLVLLGLAVGLRAVWLGWWKRLPVLDFAADDAHAFLVRVFFGLSFLVGAAVATAWAAEWLGWWATAWTLPIAGFDGFRPLGAAIVVLGSVAMMIANLGMGAAWRIGIDSENRTPLVTGGLHRWSRNPIYLSLFVGLIGIVLVVPSFLSLVLLAMAWLAAQVQVRLEEEYLRRTHGEAYAAYCRAVRRWI